VLPSVNSPTAVICSVVPNANEGEAGLNEIETSNAGKTVNVVVPVTAPEVAVIVTLPAFSVVASPALSMDVTVESLELQVAEIKSWVVPLLKIPVAAKAWLIPAGTEV